MDESSSEKRETKRQRRAWRIPSAGNISHLELVEEELSPFPEEGFCRVEVKAIGLNFADVFALLGLYSATPQGSFVPGLEFSGIIVAVGPPSSSSCPPSEEKCEFCDHSSARGVFPPRDGWQVGDKVMGVIRFGGYSSLLDCQSDLIRPLPDHFSFVEGASFLAQFCTAWYGLFDLGNVWDPYCSAVPIEKRERKNVLVHSAAGGVGLFTLYLLHKLNHYAIGTVGSSSKVDFLVENSGLHKNQVIVRDSSKFGEQLDEALSHTLQKEGEEEKEGEEKKGFDIVFDSLFGPYFQPAYDRLNPEGRHIVFGAGDMMGQSDRPSWLSLGWKYFSRPRLDPLNMISENKSLMAFNLIWLTHRVDKFRKTYNFILHMVEHQWNDKLPAAHVCKQYPFEDALEAIRFFQSGKSIGKVVLLVGDQ